MSSLFRSSPRSRGARRLAAVLALAGGTLAAGTAAACTFTGTPFGPRITGCSLGELTGGAYKGTLDWDPTPPNIPLPNLVVSQLGVSPLGNGTVELNLTVRNTAIGSAGPFDVGLVFVVVDPVTGKAISASQPPRFQPVPGLARGTSRLVRMGMFGLPSTTHEWDICMVGVADPDGAVGGPWGQVLELREDDNTTRSCCRVKPGLGGAAGVTCT
jgi:hypothetical protein